MEFRVVAKYSYGAKRPDELSFNKKDILVVLDKRDDKGWWLAQNASGEKNLIPSTYVVVIPDAPSQAEEPKKEAPAPVPELKAKATAEENAGVSDWERRAVVAERNLSELLGSLERDRLESDKLVAQAHERALLAEQQTRDAEERALEAARALEEALLQRHESSGGDESVRIGELESRIAELENEQEAHREAAIRAAELFDNYERARAAVDQLQHQLAEARRETDDVRAEMKVSAFSSK